eukprot:GHVP01054975.1.p2 GENE.GHVP01054975.1~~GHVP01054975.1.p2  ORF type:complete len:132 (-),score=22.49 GHVP01054975.1:643-1038(-)
MTSAGIQVSEECKKMYNDFKLKKSSAESLFLAVKENQIVVDKEIPKGASIEDIVKEVPTDDCRYLILDLPIAGKQKLICCLWSPEVASVRSKMIYASSLAAVSASLQGLSKTFQEEDITQLTIEDITKNHF